MHVNGESFYVSLKWLRGASRWNNGGTVYKDSIRLIIGRLKQNRT